MKSIRMIVTKVEYAKPKYQPSNWFSKAVDTEYIETAILHCRGHIHHIILAFAAKQN